MIKRKISKDEKKTTNKISKTPKNKKSVVAKKEKSTSPSPTLEFQYIANEDHYDLVIEKIKSVKKTLWIGTADIKDLYVKSGRSTKPLLEILSDLAKSGVEIRLIHAKEPGKAFREDFDKYPILIEGMERIICPRVHFKIIIFDLKTAYVGSANLTGAGLGMKGSNTRNFEAGVLSSNKEFVKQASQQFDQVWMGAHCKDCKRKQFCGDPIVP
jgi:phosphatidylserine/phosphatidylglycerophosphate/cardiolipin synthase-like enzyme